MKQVTKIYHTPFAKGKTHLGYFSVNYFDAGMADFVTVCQPSQPMVVAMCDGGSRDISIKEAEYFDSFNPAVDCKFCLAWKGFERRQVVV